MTEKYKKSIMIVEDDPLVLDIYITKIVQEGYDVISAENGAKAMEKLTVEGERPDLILLDIMMPYMDGWSILKEIKANQDLKDIPVIILSNLAEKKDMEKGMALGAEDYLIKSRFTPSEAMEKIKEYLK